MPPSTPTDVHCMQPAVSQKRMWPVQVDAQLGRLVSLLDLKKTVPKLATPAADPQTHQENFASLPDDQPIASESKKHASQNGDAGAQKPKRQRTGNADM